MREQGFEIAVFSAAAAPTCHALVVGLRLTLVILLYFQTEKEVGAATRLVGHVEREVAVRRAPVEIFVQDLALLGPVVLALLDDQLLPLLLSLIFCYLRHVVEIVYALVVLHHEEIGGEPRLLVFEAPTYRPA